MTTTEAMIASVAAACDRRSAIWRYHDAVIDELRRKGMLSRAVAEVLDEAARQVDESNVDDNSMVF